MPTPASGGPSKEATAWPARTARTKGGRQSGCWVGCLYYLLGLISSSQYQPVWWCFSSSPGLLSTSRDSATSTSNPLTCSGQSTNICSTSPVCQTRVTARLQSECCRSFLLHVPHSQPPPLPGSQPQVQVSSLLYLLTQFSLIILLKLTILYFIIKVTNEIFNVQY